MSNKELLSDGDRTLLDAVKNSPLANNPYLHDGVRDVKMLLGGEENLKRMNELDPNNQAILKKARDNQAWWMSLWAYFLAAFSLYHVALWLFHFIALLSNGYYNQWGYWIYHIVFDTIIVITTLPVIVLTIWRFKKYTSVVKQLYYACFFCAALALLGLILPLWKGIRFWGTCGVAGWTGNLTITPEWWINANPTAMCDSSNSGLAFTAVILTMIDFLFTLISVPMIWYLMSANDNWALIYYRRKTGKDISDFYDSSSIESKVRIGKSMVKKHLEAKGHGYHAHDPGKVTMDDFIQTHCGPYRKDYESQRYQQVKAY